MLYEREKALMPDVHETCCVKIQMKTIPMYSSLIYKRNAIHVLVFLIKYLINHVLT